MVGFRCTAVMSDRQKCGPPHAQTTVQVVGDYRAVPVVVVLLNAWEVRKAC